MSMSTQVMTTGLGDQVAKGTAARTVVNLITRAVEETRAVVTATVGGASNGTVVTMIVAVEPVDMRSQMTGDEGGTIAMAGMAMA